MELVFKDLEQQVKHEALEEEAKEEVKKDANTDALCTQLTEYSWELG